MRPAEADELLKGVNLIIIDPGQVPPHLMLSIGTVFYSLEAKGKTIDGSTRGLLSFMKRTGKPAIFVSLQTPPGGLMSLQSQMDMIMSGYETVNESTTCIGPIREFCTRAFGIDCSNARFIFELLPLLEEQGIITVVQEVNVNATTLDLPQYDLGQVQEHILKMTPANH